MDGTGRLTIRNRRFLRKVQPYQPRQPVAVTSPNSEPVLQEGDRRNEIRQEGDRFDEVPAVNREMEQPERTQEILAVQREPRVEQHVPLGDVGGQDRLAVGGDSQVTQEPSRSGRVKKTNVKYGKKTWDLDTDLPGGKEDK